VQSVGEGQGSGARGRHLPSAALVPGRAPGTLLLAVPLPSCQPVPVPGSRLTGTEAVFFAVKTCSHLNYFSSAEIKIK